MADILIELAIRRDYHRIAEELQEGHFQAAKELAQTVDECRELLHL